MPSCDLTIPSSLRVMTYNIRYDEASDPLTWPERSAPLAALLRRERPDVIGIQEALRHQLADLEAALPEYAWVGTGRGSDREGTAYQPELGEYNPVFYRRERLILRDSGTFWLSETPQLPGSRGLLSELPRICTWASFTPRDGQPFFLFNTHFPHAAGREGRAARAFAAGVLLAQLRELEDDLPVVLTGDFNANASDPAEQQGVLALLAEDYLDSALIAPERSGPTETFFGFDSHNAWGVRIDYVWVSRQPTTRVQRYRVLNDQLGRYYLSDHLPVVAELTWA